MEKALSFACFAILFCGHAGAQSAAPFNGTCPELCKPKDLSFTADKVS